MLSDDEAIAVVLGLLAAQRMGLAATAEAVDGALAKIHRVLPEALRRRVEALEKTLEFTSPATVGAPVATDAALLLAAAIRRRRRVTARYRSFEGEESERDVSPHGLVVHSGRWYLTAYDHGRDALRTFRVDRMRRVAVAAGAARPAPDGFDAVAYVSLSLARVPWPYEVEVLLRLPLADATGRLPATLAEFAEEDGGTRVRMRTSSLDWTAGLLAGLGCEFTIRRPHELRESVRALADRLTACLTP